MENVRDFQVESIRLRYLGRLSVMYVGIPVSQCEEVLNLKIVLISRVLSNNISPVLARFRLVYWKCQLNLRYFGLIALAYVIAWIISFGILRRSLSSRCRKLTRVNKLSSAKTNGLSLERHAYRRDLIACSVRAIHLEEEESDVLPQHIFEQWTCSCGGITFAIVLIGLMWRQATVWC